MRADQRNALIQTQLALRKEFQSAMDYLHILMAERPAGDVDPAIKLKVDALVAAHTPPEPEPTP